MTTPEISLYFCTNTNKVSLSIMELVTTWLKARFLNVGCGLWYVSDVCIAPQPTKKTFKSHFLQHETFNILLFSRSFLSMNVSGHLCSSVSCAAASFSYPLLIIRSCQIIWLLRAWSRNRKKQKKKLWHYPYYSSYSVIQSTELAAGLAAGG